jgi:hypothetical protein
MLLVHTASHPGVGSTMGTVRVGNAIFQVIGWYLCLITKQTRQFCRVTDRVSITGFPIVGSSLTSPLSPPPATVYTEAICKVNILRPREREQESIEVTSFRRENWSKLLGSFDTFFSYVSNTMFEPGLMWYTPGLRRLLSSEDLISLAPNTSNSRRKGTYF